MISWGLAIGGGCLGSCGEGGVAVEYAWNGKGWKGGSSRRRAGARGMNV
jgi:hypothetical protein